MNFAGKENFLQTPFAKSSSRQSAKPAFKELPVYFFPQTAMPINRKAGCACGGGCPGCQTNAANLPVSHPTDASEIEADQIAEKVMRMPESAAFSDRKDLQFNNDNSSVIQAKSFSDSGAGGKSGGKINSSSGGGGKLNADTRIFMENRFGRDFGNVNIHTDGEAARMSRQLNARAFTVGSDVYFNEGEFQPHSEGGKHLLAHELAHVLQQGDGVIRRCADPKKNDPQYDALAKKIQDHAVYKALAPHPEVPDPKGVADTILVEAKKKNDCLYILGKLKLLFDTPLASKAGTAKATKAAIAAESKKETERVAKQDPKITDKEEDASKAAAPRMKTVAGKIGGGKYQIDKTDLGNVVVKLKIQLVKAGTATDDDVKKIEDMQDGIEKAAAIKGFILDVEFVKAADAESFTVEVFPEAWTVATKWGSGGNPLAYAHEIFHLIAFELDRYNYIESHSANTVMEIPLRLHWFAAQLTKPAGFDDPTSIMASGSHPTEEDICMIIGEGTVPADCVKDRKKAIKP